jgi:hypothetical protein
MGVIPVKIPISDMVQRKAKVSLLHDDMRRWRDSELLYGIINSLLCCEAVVRLAYREHRRTAVHLASCV